MPATSNPASPSRLDRRPRSPSPRRPARESIAKLRHHSPAFRSPNREPSQPDAATSDEVLLERYRDLRGPDDFNELFRRYAGRLGRYLARYLGDPALAEDVLQDTFLRVYAKCRLYQDGWPVRPWLYAVAVHCAVDALRRSKPYATRGLDEPFASDDGMDFVSPLDVLADDRPGPLEQAHERELGRWVRDCVAKLPEPMRQTLVLAYDEDLSYAEITGRLGVPLGTVKSRLHAAIARLREMAERQAQMEHA